MPEAALSTTSSSIISSTTLAAVIPSGVSPSAGFGFPTAIAIAPAGTGFPTGGGIAPSGFPSALSFPGCASVTCGLSGTPSTPYCHDDQNQLYTINCGISFLGSTMITVPGWEADLAGCTDACSSSPECEAVNYDAAAQTCTMVDGVSGIDFAATIIGGWKGYWAQYAADPTASAGLPGTAPLGSAPFGSAPLGTAPIIGTASIPTSNSVPLSTGVTAAPTSTLSSTLVGTAGTSGFPSLSVNSSGISVGATGTGGYPGTGYPFPTGFPSPSGSPGNGSYPACSETSCDDAYMAYCTDVTGQLYTLNCGVKFTGTIALNASSNSLAECQSICDGLPMCLAFNYGFRQCQVMSHVTGIEYPEYGWTGAWRGLWLGGAPPAGVGSTGTSGLPINSANSSSTTSVPLGTGSVTAPATSTNAPSASSTITPSAGTSGFPSISANSSEPVGSTGFVPSGIYPTGTGYPGTPFPTGRPSNTSSNATFASCASTACSAYGAVYCTDDQHQPYTVNCGIKFEGVVSTTFVVSGVDICADACDGMGAGCVAYNYALMNSSCSFFEVVTGADYPAPGYIAAWKGFWAGGAPPAASSGVPVNSANVTFPATGSYSVPLSTGVSAAPTASANSITLATPVTSSSSSVIIGTGTSGFPSDSANTSSPAGPTGFIPTGGYPTGGFPPGGYPTGGFPRPTGTPSNISSCALATCAEGQTYCTDSAGSLYTLNCGLKFTGIATNVSATSLDACQSVCDGMGGGCMGVNFNGVACEVVKVITGVQYPAPGWIAAWKGIWAGGAPVVPSSAIPVNSANSTTTFSVSVPLGTGSVPTTSNSSVAEPVTASSTTSSIATSGFPSNSANSSAPAGPTSYPSPPSNVTYSSCASARCSNTTFAPIFCTDSQDQLYTVNCGLKFTGVVSDIVNGTYGLDACEQLCDPSEQCLGVNYNGVSCEMMAVVTGVQYPAPGWMAAWKGLWVGGAPEGNGSFPTFPNGTLPINGTFPVNSTAPGNTTSPVQNATSTSTSVTVPLSTGVSTTTLSSIATTGFPLPSPNTTTSAIGTSVPISTGSPSSPNGTYPLCAATGCPAEYCIDAAGQLYSTTCNSAFIGTFLNITGAISKRDTATILECEAACDSVTACVALNYDGSCTYLSTVTGIETKNGSVAIWKGYWGTFGGNGTYGGYPPTGNGSYPVGNGTFPPLPSGTGSYPTSGTTAVQNATSSISSATPSSSSPLATSSDPSTTSASASVPATSGFPLPSSNSSSYIASPTGVLSTNSSSNGSYPICSSMGCYATYQSSVCADETGQPFTMTCGTAFEGTFISEVVKSQSGASLLDCEAVCDSDEHCIALNYERGSCSYLSAVTGIEVKNGSIAVWKGIWAGGAPPSGGNGSYPFPPNGTFPSGGFPGPSSGFPAPSSGLPASSSGFPVPSANATTSSTTTASITATVTSTVSTSSFTSTASNATVADPTSFSSSSSSQSSTSSSVSVPLSTATPGGNSSLPTNATVPSCDAPAITDCAAGYGLGASTFCKDGSNQTYTVTCGIQFIGPVISNTSASSLSSCENQCDASYSCVALDFIDGSSCILISAIYGVVENPASIAAYRGVWLGGPPGGNGTYGGGNGTFPGSPIPSVPAGNITSSSTGLSSVVSALPTASANSTLPSGSTSLISASPTPSVKITSTPSSSPSVLISATSSSSTSVTSFTTYTTLCTENGTQIVHTHSAPITSSPSTSVSLTATTSSSNSAPLSPSLSITATSSSVSTSTGTDSTTKSASATSPSTSSASTNAAPTGGSGSGSGTCDSSYPLCSPSAAAYSSSGNATYCVDDSCQLWTLTSGIKFSGATVPSSMIKRNVSTLLECEDKCDTSSACVALNYINSTCTFLSSINGTTNVNGSIGAYKGSWEGGSPISPVGIPSGSTSSSISATSTSSAVSSPSQPTSSATGSTPVSATTPEHSSTSSISTTASSSSSLSSTYSSAQSSTSSSATLSSGASTTTGTSSASTRSAGSTSIAPISSSSSSSTPVPATTKPHKTHKPSTTSEKISTSSKHHQSTKKHSTTSHETSPSSYKPTSSPQVTSSVGPSSSKPVSSSAAPTTSFVLVAPVTTSATFSSSTTASTPVMSRSAVSSSSVQTASSSPKTSSSAKETTSSSAQKSGSLTSSTKPASTSTHKASSSEKTHKASTTSSESHYKPTERPTTHHASTSTVEKSSSSHLTSSSASPVKPSSYEGGSSTATTSTHSSASTSSAVSSSSSSPVAPVSASTSSASTSSATPSSSLEPTTSTHSSQSTSSALSTSSSSPVAPVTASTSSAPTSSASPSTTSKAATTSASSSAGSTTPSTLKTLTKTSTTSSTPTSIAAQPPSTPPYQPSGPPTSPGQHGGSGEHGGSGDGHDEGHGWGGDSNGWGEESHGWGDENHGWGEDNNGGDDEHGWGQDNRGPPSSFMKAVGAMFKGFGGWGQPAAAPPAEGKPQGNGGRFGPGGGW